MLMLLDIHEIKDSTHTSYWPTKVATNATWAIYRPDEKHLKRYWKDGIEFSINDNTKSPQIYTLPQFLSMSEKNYGIYWLESINLLTPKNSLESSKQLKIVFLFMPVLNKLQCKQFLCILTLPKCNAKIIDQIYTTDRP